MHFVFLFLLLASVPQGPPASPDCREWHECQRLALDAASQGEYERFHDLAWRAIQTGPKNDPSLMLMLARAQSLSGRPHDALVMLQRLAAMGIATDAATNDDFRRVRKLPGWAEFAAGAREATTSPKAAETKPAVPAPAERVATKPPEAVAPPPTAPKPAMAAAVTTREGDEAVRFDTLPFTPAGLAYDAVSRRFIVGDRRARRLAVVDEFSHHVANLASAQSAGFGDIAALEIDPRQGDLWVISADGEHATLHKLQLVSGRVLATYVPGERLGAAEFVDVATTGESGVLVLDRAAHRILHLRPKGSALELLVTLPDANATTLAPTPEGAVYVAHAHGISRVDLATRTVTEIRTVKGIDPGNIVKLRWHKGALIAVQRHDDRYRAVRIGFDRQGRAASIEPIGASLSGLDPTAAAISGGTFYYLADADDAQMTVRKVQLK
jgi:hypothetical protein